MVYLAKFEKQLLININPNNVSKVFDLALEYFEQKDFAMENSSKPSFASFTKGSYAKDLVGWTIWPFMSSKDSRIKYNISFNNSWNSIQRQLKQDCFII